MVTSDTSAGVCVCVGGGHGVEWRGVASRDMVWRGMEWRDVV